MKHQNKHLSNPTCTCSPLLVKAPWSSANTPFYVELNQLLQIYYWSPIPVLFGELRNNVLRGWSSSWFTEVIVAFFKNLQPLSLWGQILSAKFLFLPEQIFAKVLIILVLCILSPFSKIYNPLPIIFTFLQNVLNALPMELLVCPLLKTYFSLMDELFVTFPEESALDKIVWARFVPENSFSCSCVCRVYFRCFLYFSFWNKLISWLWRIENLSFDIDLACGGIIKLKGILRRPW